jgi:hypothetical protein
LHAIAGVTKIVKATLDIWDKRFSWAGPDRKVLPAPARALCVIAVAVGLASGRPLPAVELPIEVVADPEPGALRGWHLYVHDGDAPTVGDRVAVVGQYETATGRVMLRQPPWLTVRPEPGAGRGRTRQVFSVGVGPAPEGLDADGFVRCHGVLVADEPGPDGDAPRYRLATVQTEPIRLARPIATLEADAPAVVEREAKRLRAICAAHGLRYDPAAEPLGMSWHRGRIAFTSRLSAQPPFSFKPVPYATVSVLYDPATGAAERLVVTRRMWADPPD